MLRTSRTTALALLPGYALKSRILEPSSLAFLRSLRDLYQAYGLRITQLSLSADIESITLDVDSPHLSPIPPSVTCLTLGPSPTVYRRLSADQEDVVREVDRKWVAMSAAAADWPDREPWRLPDSLSSLQSEREEARQPPWLHDLDCLVPLFACLPHALSCPLPADLLPTGLCALVFNDAYKHPLQPGSLPSTLTFLHLGYSFGQPIAPGVLPASLVYLSVNGAMHQHHELLLQSLPASLQRLRLSLWLHPLQAEGWPPRLTVLHLGGFSHPLQPHVLPSSLLHLSFEYSSPPLLPDVLPSCLVELHLSDTYRHTLLPGVLPSCLRRLTVRGAFRHPLQVGSLPDGLLFLRFDSLPSASLCPLPRLHPGVLPSTLLGIDFQDRYARPLCLQASSPRPCGGCDCRASTATRASRRCCHPTRSVAGTREMRTGLADTLSAMSCVERCVAERVHCNALTCP